MYVFNEIQRFNQWWLYVLYALLLGILAYFCYQWFVLGQATGNVGPKDSFAQLIMAISTVLPIAFMFLLRLETTIDEKGVSYRFFPFQLSHRKISWKDITHCYTRTYRPIREYGGWGYRSGFGKRKALNVKGDQGIQIKLLNNKELLIGTQNPVAAQTVINRYFVKKNNVM